MTPDKELPIANEPQDVSEAGGTPYKYLFAETDKKIKGFSKKVKKEVKEKKDV